MRVLITGAGGFVGRHLCAELRAKGAQVFAVGRPGTRSREYANAIFEVDGVPGRSDLEAIVVSARPDIVYHLAGTSAASTLKALYETNLFYGAQLFEAVKACGIAPRIVIAGSAAEYGLPVVEGRPFREDDRALPVNAYGETKLSQTVHALRHADLPVIVARIFNPIGEGLPNSRAIGRFVELAKALKTDGGGVIETGPLNSIRDIVDVRSVSAALVDMARDGLPTGEIYNLCSGHGTVMQNVADAIAALLPYPVEFRPGAGESGVDWAIGNPAKLAGFGIEVGAPDLSDVLGKMLYETAGSLGGVVQ